MKDQVIETKLSEDAGENSNSEKDKNYFESSNNNVNANNINTNSNTINNPNDKSLKAVEAKNRLSNPTKNNISQGQ